MQEIIHLLKEKNRCLEKFYQINEQELYNLAEGVYDNVETFYASRDGILEVVRIIDLKIERSNRVNSASEVDDISKREILSLLDFKNEIVTRILSQDLQILSFIEKEKSNIINELRQVRASKKAVGSYKSGISTRRLDEEA